MKKLFTFDDIMVSLISALGYGFGETISRISGWPMPACIIACLVVGLAAGSVVDRIAFSKAVQKKPKNRVLMYAICILVFVAAHIISKRLMGVSMLSYLAEELLWTVGLPVVGFVINLLIRGYRIHKIRERYGDGKDGFVFDVTDEDIKELDKNNEPILGEYDTDCAVKTRTGIYVGEKEGHVLSFLGIPYAKPPVGDLRWKAPEPLPASEAVFEAKYFGASCIQVEHKGEILKLHRQSEDCLSLNICISTKTEEPKKPVLIIFHHGDFSFGGSANPLLSGGEFVKEHPGIVFVSFNYRVGIFGFIDFTGIPGSEAYPDALNLGLLDQIMALQWIKENIASFGGDPDRITAAGFEAGAVSISLLAASERAKGLFRKAFVFAGSPAIAYVTPEVSRALAKKLLQETGTQTVDELARLSTESLRDAEQKLWMDLSVPTCDGSLIPADVFKAYQEGVAAGIDFMIVISSNERQVFRAIVGDSRYKDYIDSLTAEMLNFMDGMTSGAMRKYIEEQIHVVPEVEAKARTIEEWMALSMVRSAARLKEGGNRVYLMYWGEKPLIESLGSGMVDVAETLLGNYDTAQMYGSVINKDLSEILQSLLEKYINGEALSLYSNEIRGVGAIAWKAYPRVLTVSDGRFRCGIIDDILEESDDAIINRR